MPDTLCISFSFEHTYTSLPLGHWKWAELPYHYYEDILYREKFMKDENNISLFVSSSPDEI